MVMPKQMTRALPVGVVMLALMSQPALAAVLCTFTITNVDFGSIDLLRGGALQTTGTISATCIDGAADDGLTICVHLPEGSGGLNSGGTRRTMKNDTAAMEYNLSIAGEEWGTIGGPFTPFLWQVPLNSSGNFNGTQSISGSVSSFQTTLPAGVYTDSFTGSTATKIEYKQGQNDCTSVGDSAAETDNATFIATADNIAACTVSATNITFVSVLSLKDFNVAATGSINVRCTTGISYQVGLDGGLDLAKDPLQRKMTLDGGEEQVTYQLHRNAARNPADAWGNTINTNTAGGIGSGGLPPDGPTFTVYGRVPMQTTPSPGTYTDTIIVTVTF
jgi:spore coat protein U-like protein